jgi:DNA helicase-2/ATP-dependent DNA helicase PcrA
MKPDARTSACRRFEDAFFTHKVVVDIRDIIQFAFDMKNVDIFMGIYYKFCLSISRKAAIYACDMRRKSGRSILDELLDSSELSTYSKDGVRNLQIILEAMGSYSAEEALNIIWGNLRYGQFVAERKLDAGKIDILRLLARREKDALTLLMQQSFRTGTPDGMMRLLDLLEQIMDRTNIYRLGCNMDPEAAYVAYDGMQK